MLRTTREIGAAIAAAIRKSIWQFLLVHAFYTALGFIVFAPLLGGLGQIMLNISSQPVLADTDILFFLLTPFGIAALILFSSLLVTMIIFQQASVMALYTGLASGHNQDLVQILRHTAAHSLKIFFFSVHLVARLLLIIAPFLAASGLIAWLSLSDYDINYYLSVKPPVFLAAAAAIGLVLLSMGFILIRKLLSWSLALPLIVFTEISAAASFRKSRELVAGSRRTVAMTLIGWALASLLLGILLLGLIQLLSSQILPLFYSSMNVLIMVIGFVLVLFTLGNFFVTTLTSASFGALLVELFRMAGQSISLENFADGRQSPRFRLSPSSLVGLLICGTLVSALVGVWLISGIQTSDDLVIVAHRGAAGKAPENTMASIRQAIEDKTDWVEIDVQETADGHVVVVHDSDFMKLSGVNLKVWEASLERLERIDVGSWFGAEFSAERVPTLREVLQEVRGRARLVIELKYYGHDQQLEQRVIDIVEEMNMVDETAIMSLKYDAISKVRKLRPDWTIGLLSAQVLGNMSSLDADFLAVNTAMAGPSFIKSSQKSGKQVFVWTVNDKMSMFRMMSLGIDGIITDEPELARQVIAERAQLNSVERLLIHTAVILGGTLPQKAYRDNSP